MRSRRLSKEHTPPPPPPSTSAKRSVTTRSKEGPNIADMSRNAVDKVVRRVTARSSLRGRKEQDNRSKGKEKQVVDAKATWSEVDAQRSEKLRKERNQKEVGATSCPLEGSADEGDDDIDWEDGSTSVMDPVKNCSNPGGDNRTLTIEFGTVPDSSKRKPARRATAEEKELAELVHRAHLLCLLARGRVVDSACDDLLIQFHNNFRVRSAASETELCSSSLAIALGRREGSAEEIAALSVALFRALKLTTRFVSILDVASLKPDFDDCESSSRSTSRVRRGIFTTSTPMVDRLQEDSMFPRRKKIELPAAVEFKAGTRSSLPGDRQDISPGPITEKNQGSKRKCDIEFEMQLQMALSATAVDAMSPNTSCSEVLPSPKRTRRLAADGSTPISTAIGSKKMGSPLYWAEIYCMGENLAGKWVHVDAINAIIDGEHKVEAAAAACKTSLRYVVAFAGRGAKDVTRRYCMKWHKIASQRVNSAWWDDVLAPLRELESGATEGQVQLVENGCIGSEADGEPSWINSFGATRNSLEDLELETRVLTEPLPTNQQAYRTHRLYALERWLTKFQILHPKGPILGFCSGKPVYPRTCVQTLKTKERWLREALQVKANELPAKVLKDSKKLDKKVEFLEDGENEECNSEGNIELYGQWQLEPLQLPRAVNGIVPRNERGQVDVWSEKCLPPGTVHIRLPRVFNVAKRLGIDYAPAMVGFEFRNGRSLPVFDGIVVCAEFKDAILDAYDEEEDRRKAEEKRRDEVMAVSRWYQLLSSMITRERLNKLYGDNPSVPINSNVENANSIAEKRDDAGQRCDTVQSPSGSSSKGNKMKAKVNALPFAPTEEHQHVFLVEDESFDEQSSVTTKRCYCGFSIEVEQL
ncbi:DNA repair protein RAD4 [Linum grandiflorum]